MFGKIIISGAYTSFIIIELKESEALFLKEIMESKLVSYSKIFFELKSYKKLGYKSLDDLPVKLSISGFLTQLDDSITTPSLKFFRNDKMVFKCALNRLEHKYHKSLFKEHDLISSYLAVNEFNFRKRKGFHYFFLKKEQIGEFKFSLEEDLDLSDVLFKHTKHYFRKIYHETVELLKLQIDNSTLEVKRNKSKGKFIIKI